ncbi:GAF domain-containing SpoIIE family protein phosphatase [Cryptosporangium minutisporangium]|uniref:GAF domain-containing protein n=1 Tax=Cryptosporangium minutisporangium TaxID=113569 RepID=A0ABP6SQ37_9ACTN
MTHHSEALSATVAPLPDPARLAALHHTGLTAQPDTALDRFADLVRKILDVPVVLISLVNDTCQFFPGASGLGQPWMTERQTPLSHSFCQQVVVSGRPLVVTDARQHPDLRTSPAIPDLGVVANAGMPLTDGEGHVLGSLCAIDHRPRNWNAHELDLLTDLAAACSSELRLRISGHRAETALQRTVDASAAREQAQAEAERLAADVDTALRHSRVLLGASEALQGALTVDDVVRAVSDLVSGDLAPTHVGVMFLDRRSRRLNLVTPEPLPAGPAERWATVPADSDQPAARAVRDQRPLFFRSRSDFQALFPDQVGDLDQIGWQALVCAPLLSSDGPLGTLRFAWTDPQRLDVGERAVILSLAGYVTQALERARHLHERSTVAETLQRAMLTDLPTAPPYQLAARYEPAHRVEQVGGDWYDAVALPDDRLALVIGDVTGHDIGAAARMGQLRSMLRAYLIDQPDSPADALQRLDSANYVLGDRTLATALVAVVEPDGEEGHRLRWSPAGHPPPIVLHPDGTTEALTASDLMLGVRPRTRRTTHTAPIPAGGTLLLYTDGLAETRTANIDTGIARLRQFLTAHRHLPLEELLDALLSDGFGFTHHDDIAVLALRVP